MIGDIVESLENGENVPVDLRVKPSLLTLLFDQAALLDSSLVDRDRPDLRGGFDDTREIISWYQRAAVRTIGRIGDYWDPVDCVADESLHDSLLGNGSGAKRHRMVVEAHDVQPACNQAYVALRDSATEYTKADRDETQWTDKQLDPTKQSNVAMRPGYQTVDDQQSQALADLWGGFVDEDELLNWLHSLNSPTNGEIGDDFAWSVVADDVAMARLVHERDCHEARTYRVVFAASRLLPAFVAGVREMETSELAKAQGDGPTTLRQ